MLTAKSDSLHLLQQGVVFYGKEHEVVSRQRKRLSSNVDIIELLQGIVFDIVCPAQPGFEGFKGSVVFLLAGPNGLALIEADFVLPFPLAFLAAAKMRQVGDRENAAQGYMLIVTMQRRT